MILMLLVMLVQVLILARATSIFAALSGRNPTLWFALGLCLPIVSLLALTVLPDRGRGARPLS